MVQLRPSPADLTRLKVPLGNLLQGSPSETIPKLRKLVDDQRPPIVSTVGDVVSRETMRQGLRVHLRIIDNKTLRQPISAIDLKASKTYRVKNPAGVISGESWEAIREAMRDKVESVIVVDGEEDLLALPCIVESPDDAFVVYGQPSHGIVVVKTSQAVKVPIRALLESMAREES